jgi:CubicO group peptidase (beta-lactamase class C family)
MKQRTEKFYRKYILANYERIMSLTRMTGTAVFLSLLLIACHSRSQPAALAGHLGVNNVSRFHEIPVKAIIAPLQYDTLSEARRNTINQLDQYYRRQVAAGFNGGVLIGLGGKVIYERYFGYSSRERKMPMGPYSSSQLASVSKTLTGVAVLYLYEHKHITLDTPVQSYLKDFPYPNITVKMLLNHRSGLPDYTKWYETYSHDSKTPVNNATIMALMAAHVPRLEFRPNSRFKYCNTNYAVLARIIEHVSEMSYYDFMAKYIFQPLGMNNSFVYNPQKGLPPIATSSYKHNWIREPDMFADGVYGDKGTYSTPEDMYRFDQSFYHNTLLSNPTIDLAYGPCSFEKKGVKNYGLGWRMLCYSDGNKVIYHNGWWHGNNTSFYRLIKDNMTIVVLGNRFTNSIYHQAPAIYSIVKGVAVVNGFDTEE